MCEFHISRTPNSISLLLLLYYLLISLLFISIIKPTQGKNLILMLLVEITPCTKSRQTETAPCVDDCLKPYSHLVQVVYIY